MKSEVRNPKSERNPKPKARTPDFTPHASRVTNHESRITQYPPMKSLLTLSVALLALAAPAADLRLGIIGTDTSHVVAFTKLFNDAADKDHLPGARVVVAFKGGSPDNAASAKYVNVYAEQIRTNHGVRLVESIPALCEQVDAVLLLSVDGRPHLEQVRPVMAAKKPVFIDKPMAGSLRDVVEIFRLAKDAGVPVFSASALRFASNTVAARAGAIGTITNALTTGPCEIEPHHPDLFWYGVHGTEALFTLLGPGCETVQRRQTPAGKIEVTGTWRGGAKGTFREDPKFGGSAEGSRGAMPVGNFDGYVPLAREILKFFQTGVSPVPPQETVEIFAFMEAADASKREDGRPVAISNLLHQAGWPLTR